MFFYEHVNMRLFYKMVFHTPSEHFLFRMYLIRKFSGQTFNFSLLINKWELFQEMQIGKQKSIKLKPNNENHLKVH